MIHDEGVEVELAASFEAMNAERADLDDCLRALIGKMHAVEESIQVQEHALARLRDSIDVPDHPVRIDGGWKPSRIEVLRKMQEKPETPQRKLAEELGFSLGKLNYCLKALQKKGLVKLENFQKQTNKINYLQYVITRKGITERTKLTINFMKKKMKEYDELKKELKENQ